MVFGGKASARPKLPQPPTVDQLLEDLKVCRDDFTDGKMDLTKIGLHVD